MLAYEDYNSWTSVSGRQIICRISAEMLERRKRFGRRIVQLRKECGLSQEGLALRAGLDRSYMGRIERGEQSVSLDKIWEIADALGTTPGDFFRETN